MSDVAITEALRAQTTGPLKLSAAQAVSPRAGLEEASNQFDSLRLSLQRGPQTTVPLVSSWLSNRAADSNPRIRHDPYKGWEYKPLQGVHLALFVGHRLFSRGRRSLQTRLKFNRAQDVDSIPGGVPEITTDFLPLRLASVTCRADLPQNFCMTTVVAATKGAHFLGLAQYLSPRLAANSSRKASKKNK